MTGNCKALTFIYFCCCCLIFVHMLNLQQSQKRKYCIFFMIKGKTITLLKNNLGMMFVSADLIRLIMQRFKRKLFRAEYIFHPSSCICLVYIRSNFFSILILHLLFTVFYSSKKKNYDNFKNRPWKKLNEACLFSYDNTGEQLKELFVK